MNSGEREIVDSNPQKASFDEALSLLQSGDASAAEQICRDALDSYPEDVNILCLSARALIRLQKFDEAENHLNKALVLFPESARTHEILGELLLVQKKPEQAVDVLKRAVHFGIDSTEVDQKLSTALMMLGRSRRHSPRQENTNAAVTWIWPKRSATRF